ncbi:MAG: hypothetical protein QOE86_2479 [Solirubrobacteraceae bacterium]|nr:hypothetical protein [Solirubrobacteraceae bacterium]
MTASVPVPETGAQTFEVERFAWTAPDRLELEGRWSGVRGVRFVRPTLVLVAGEDHRRALALLEHKPWPAEDGASWVAAFPWAGDPMEADAGELSVAPGIAVRLPAPDLPKGVRRKSPAPAPPAAGPAKPRSPSGDQGLIQRAAATEKAQQELATQRAAREALERDHVDLRRRADAAVRDRDRAAKERDAALAARDEAVRERDSVAVVRDRLERERETLAAERDDLRGELRSTSEARDAVMDARGAAAEALHRVEAERDAAVEERDRLRNARDAVDDVVARAQAERDAAIKERDRLRRRLNEVARPPDTAAAASEQLVRLTARLDALTAERDKLAAERDRLAAGVADRGLSRPPAPSADPGLIDDLRHQLDEAVAERDEARLAAETAEQAIAAPATEATRPLPGSDPQPRWSQRVAALIAFAIVVVVLLALVLRAVV